MTAALAPPITISGPCRLCGRSDPRIVRTGDLVIDLDARTVHRGGRAVALTPMQFEVLAVLAAQQGRAVHKHVIWDRVWHWPWETGPHGEALSGSAHTIRINILRLRRALGDCDARLIVTVVGYGYRLVGPEAS